MTGSTPLLSYFLVVVLTLGTLCGPLVGLARLMEIGRVQEAQRAQLRAVEAARRHHVEMNLAAEKQAIAEKFAKASLGRAPQDSEPAV